MWPIEGLMNISFDIVNSHLNSDYNEETIHKLNIYKMF